MPFEDRVTFKPRKNFRKPKSLILNLLSKTGFMVVIESRSLLTKIMSLTYNHKTMNEDAFDLMKRE